jgi:hypothetical protein
MIPLGAIVEVVAVEINGNQLIDVIWEGREAMIFAQDLRDRGRS